MQGNTGISLLLIVASQMILCAESADLYLNADEYVEQVWVDGIKQSVPSDCKLDKHTPCLFNDVSPSDVIAVKYFSPDSAGGVLLSMSDGTLVSDNSWRCSKKKVRGWQKPNFDDSDWIRCNEINADAAIQEYNTFFGKSAFSNDAVWISKVGDDDIGNFYARKSLSGPTALTRDVEPVHLYVNADTYVEEVWVDGKKETEHSPYNCRIQDKDIPCVFKYVVPQEVIAVKYNNPTSVGGLLVSMSDGSIVSDKSWRCSKSKVPGWEKPEFDDSSWTHCHEFDAAKAISDYNQYLGENAFSDKAKWIAKNEDKDLGTFYARKCITKASGQERELELPETVESSKESPEVVETSAEIPKTADSTGDSAEIGSGDIYLNADRIVEQVWIDGTQQSVFTPSKCKLNKNIPCVFKDVSPRELIAVKYYNPGDIGGVVVSMSDGSLVSDNSWRCSKEKVSGWEKPNFDDSSWSQCKEFSAENEIGKYNKYLKTTAFSSSAMWIAIDGDYIGNFYARRKLSGDQRRVPSVPQGDEESNEPAAASTEDEVATTAKPTTVKQTTVAELPTITNTPTMKLTTAAELTTMKQTTTTQPTTVTQAVITYPQSSEPFDPKKCDASDTETVLKRTEESFLTACVESEVPLYIGWLTSSGYFNNIRYNNNKGASSKPFITHLERLRILAQAYHCDRTGNIYYQSSDIAKKIAKSLEWFGKKAPRNEDPSWWNYWIEVPSDLLPVLILMRKQVSQSVIIANLERYCNIPEKPMWNAADESGNNCGTNFAYRAKLGLYEGMLRGSSFFAQRFAEILEGVDRELVKLDTFNEEGVQKDFCLHQHNFWAKRDEPTRHLMYNGVYVGILTELPTIFNLVRGTCFTVPEVALENLANAFCECHQWLFWNYAVEPTCTGRKVAVDGLVPNAQGMKLVHIAKRLLPLGKRVSEIQKAINRAGLRTPKTSDALIGNKNLFSSAMMIHRRECYMISVRMISFTVYRPENWVNIGYHDVSLNSKGYYEGDGFTAIIRTGEEWGPSKHEVFKFYEWDHIPGASIENSGNVPQKRTRRKESDESINQESFVGGASDGNYGVAGMIYNRKPVRVYAKKSWYFFDDEFVALGADLKGKSSIRDNLHTTINQVSLNGDVTIKTYSGEIKTISSGDYTSTKKPKWVLHDGILYIPLDDAESFIVSATKKGLFLFIINHGKRNFPATYAYAVRPCISSENEADDYVKSGLSDITIPRNDADAQVVTHEGIQMTEAIIYEANTKISIIDGLEVSTNDRCMLIFKIKGSGGSVSMEITASRPDNPTTPATHVEITVKGKWKLTGSDVTGHNAGEKSTTVNREMFGGKNVGKSTTLEYQLSSW